MEMKTLLATIARQIETAKNHSGLEARRGEDESRTGAILRSLRITYLALSTGLDPWRDASHLFLMRVSPAGDYVLMQGGTTIPVDSPYLAYQFWRSGIELAPGQILLLEPELAKDAIEEALGVVALEQAFAERELLNRRSTLEVAFVLPGEEEIAALRAVEDRINLLWDKKIELIAASLLADEYLERSRALSAPEEAA